jgi:putative tryptophan/tyrosine transport system substrate-binding protein
VRRRDLTLGLLLATAVGTARAQVSTKQHRIAIITTQPVANIDDPTIPVFGAFFEELRRLGDVEGPNLAIERYSGGGRPAVYPDLAREVVARSPDVIVAIGNPITNEVRAATGTTPIVWIGPDPIQAGFATSFARPGGNITGVSMFDAEFDAKRLQILKEAAPSASKVAYLTMRRTWEGAFKRTYQPATQQASQRLQISLMPMLLQEATPSEIQHAFAEIAPDPPDAIMVAGIGELIPYRQLIVELVEKSRLPAMYGLRDFAEAGGLMAYEVDFAEAARRMADDVHEILNGAKPGDIPIYQPTKYQLVINLEAAKALGLTIPPALLARPDEVID